MVTHKQLTTGLYLTGRPIFCEMVEIDMKLLLKLIDGICLSSEDVSTEMEDFLLQTRSVILKGMERHLYLQEEVLIVSVYLKPLSHPSRPGVEFVSRTPSQLLRGE